MRKTIIWAYRDGKKYMEVMQAAQDAKKDVMDMMKQITAENKGHQITFKVR